MPEFLEHIHAQTVGRLPARGAYMTEPVEGWIRRGQPGGPVTRPLLGAATHRGGELDKLAYNCSIGRNGAGVHYRTEAR